MFRAPRRGGRRRNDGGAILLLLLARIYQAYEASPVKPPVTFGMVGLLVGAHFVKLGRLDDVCLKPNTLSVKRAIFSSLTHADDYHLYYNVGSLLTKGVLMEQKFGSEKFFIFVVYSIVVSAALYVLFGLLLAEFFQVGCAVGFSGVLFSIKAALSLLSENPTRQTSVWGVKVAAQHAHWLEIIVSSYINPRSSLIGHAAGALAGMLWVEAAKLFDENPTQPHQQQPRTRTAYTYAAGTSATPGSHSRESRRRNNVDGEGRAGEVRRRRVERFEAVKRESSS